MSLPTIPDIQPKIKLKRQDMIHLLLSSIAMEELSLSHILNAEGEKIQQMIANRPSLQELLNINYSLERTLRNTIKSQMMLQYKLEDLIDLVRMSKLQGENEWFSDQENDLDEEDDDEVEPDRFKEEEFDDINDLEDEEQDEAVIKKALLKFNEESDSE